MTTRPTDELAAAAQTLRKLATDATPGPWRQHDTHLGQYGYTATVLSGEGNGTDLRAWLPSMSHEPWDETRNAWSDAMYIAAMHPGVGAALADWLKESAVVHLPDTECGYCDPRRNPKRLPCPALAVARQINAAARP